MKGAYIQELSKLVGANKNWSEHHLSSQLSFIVPKADLVVRNRKLPILIRFGNFVKRFKCA
jgi:hypothetical protein